MAKHNFQCPVSRPILVFCLNFFTTEMFEQIKLKVGIPRYHSLLCTELIRFHNISAGNIIYREGVLSR